MATISETSLSAAAPNYVTSSANVLGKDDFLKLLVEQLKNQDPLNPLDGTEFASQLAQFSSVEQLTNMNSNLEASVTTNQLMAQSIGNSLATTMIGKEIKAAGNTLQWDGEHDLRFGFTVGAVGLKSTVKIFNADGELVKEFNPTDIPAGDTSLTWDGTNLGGKTVEKGKYTFKVEVLDAKEKAMETSSFVLGNITGVRFTANGTVFLVDGVEIPVANILEILNGATHG